MYFQKGIYVWEYNRIAITRSRPKISNLGFLQKKKRHVRVYETFSMFGPLVECSYVAEQGPHPWATFGMALGLAIVWPLAQPLVGSGLALGLALRLALGWLWPGPWLIFLRNPWPSPCPGPWLALCLGYGWYLGTY